MSSRARERREAYALKQYREPVEDEPRESECQCREPSDNDQGYCMGCGRWINYRERNEP